MCGRYTLFKSTEEINDFLNAVDIGKYRRSENLERFEFRPNYNVAPTHVMPVAYTNEEGHRLLEPMYWGFMGWKPKPGTKPFLPINTRDDSMIEKPMWSKAFTQRRCIVPANGFYEWVGKKGNKTPHYIYPSTDTFFGFAGIFSDLAPDESDTKKSYSIITTSPNKLMVNIHDRMPVILHRTEFDDWLHPDQHDPNYLSDFLRPFPDDAMKEHVVTKAVGNVRNNEEGLIQKADLFG